VYGLEERKLALGSLLAESMQYDMLTVGDGMIVDGCSGDAVE